MRRKHQERQISAKCSAYLCCIQYWIVLIINTLSLTLFIKEDVCVGFINPLLDWGSPLNGQLFIRSHNEVEAPSVIFNANTLCVKNLTYHLPIFSRSGFELKGTDCSFNNILTFHIFPLKWLCFLTRLQGCHHRG